MICPHDYCNLLRNVQSPTEAAVLARICLNVVFDPEQFPVDLSELFGLSVENMLLARGLLCWAGVAPNTYSSWSNDACVPLMEIAQAQNRGANELV